MIRLLTASLFLVISSFLTSCSSTGSNQEFYEIRTYKIDSADKQKAVLSYIDKAYVPGLKKMGLDRIGVFTNAENAKDFSVYMVIPFKSACQYTNRSDILFADKEYLENAKEFFSIPKDKPAYSRIESSFFKAFSGIPTMEIPAFAKAKKPRIYELRIYESHNEEKAMLKRDMFNVDKEIQLMRDLKMGPVFFGECLSGHNAPNLSYFLSAESFEDNKAYWDVFRNHPRWQVMKNIPRYKDTVSKIDVVYLKPTSGSDW
ncbi:MAG: NIPSNAP family protein [Lentisphaeraceae bacterium]|nr:NIPSNAP family protein [Lentisphaeraceae bacterium]